LARGEPPQMAQLVIVLDSAPVIVVASGVDWPAIVASISTGVAAVAGIAAALWQASRNWHHEDQRTKIGEKRRIYANCLAVLETATQAAIFRDAYKGRDPRNATAKREYNDALAACLNAVSELALISPKEVGRLGAIAAYKIHQYSSEDMPTAITEAITDLIRAMRTDLGESVSTREEAAIIAETLLKSSHDTALPASAGDRRGSMWGVAPSWLAGSGDG
jgi:hypothetical protein